MAVEVLPRPSDESLKNLLLSFPVNINPLHFFPLSARPSPFTDQHGGAEVELLEELRDEAVRLGDAVRVDRLDLFDDVEQPLVVLLTPRHPDEVQLRRESGDIEMDGRKFDSCSL